MHRRLNPVFMFVFLGFLVFALIVGYNIWFYSNCEKWHTKSYVSLDKECIVWDKKGNCITYGLVPERHTDTICDVWKH